MVTSKFMLARRDAWWIRANNNTMTHSRTDRELIHNTQYTHLPRGVHTGGLHWQEQERRVLIAECFISMYIYVQQKEQRCINATNARAAHMRAQASTHSQSMHVHWCGAGVRFVQHYDRVKCDCVLCVCVVCRCCVSCCLSQPNRRRRSDDDDFIASAGWNSRLVFYSKAIVLVRCVRLRP